MCLVESGDCWKKGHCYQTWRLCTRSGMRLRLGRTSRGTCPGVHGMSPSGPGVAKSNSHGKIVLRVASREDEIRTRAYEIYLARGAEPGRELEDWLQAERELTAE